MVFAMANFVITRDFTQRGARRILSLSRPRSLSLYVIATPSDWYPLQESQICEQPAN